MKAQKDWNFELSPKDEIDDPIFHFVGFQESVWRDNQEPLNDLYGRLHMFCSHGIISTDEYSDDGTN